VHRSGRTGRAGATGFVVTLVIPEKQKDVVALGRAIGQPVSFEPAAVPLAEKPAAPAVVAAPPAKKAAKPAKVARDRERAARHQDRVASAPSGTVKFFDPKKGYGFIVDQRGKDVFVHVSAVQASGLRVLEPGQRVTFDLEQGRKGDEAHRLTVTR
jgi:CspA family cold shock protein